MRLEEYTLKVIRREDWNVWEAQVLEFYALIATGETESEARVELQRLYAERLIYHAAIGKPLPIPGEIAEEMFSSTNRIDAQAALARDFFHKVLHLDYDNVFLNDASTLEEFGDLSAIRNRAFSIYDVDIGLEAERPLWTILELIRARSR
jgi:hypothetical protein